MHGMDTGVYVHCHCRAYLPIKWPPTTSPSLMYRRRYTVLDVRITRADGLALLQQHLGEVDK